jgi:anti-sigma B factor antagonist
MIINKELKGENLEIKLNGRLDTNTAPELEKELNISITDVKSLIFDLENLIYISSAGLRVFLLAQKIMYNQGKMILINVNELIMDVFEATGFVDILTIE